VTWIAWNSVTSFAVLTAQIFVCLNPVALFITDLVLFFQEPAGYSNQTAGLLGAVLILAGLLSAIVTSPLFDRVFTHHLALTVKFLIPGVTGAWLSMIWAVKPHNTGGLFAVMAIIGVGSITLLPVGLELACELTRNPAGSSALLWFSCVPFVRTFFRNSRN
jgi:hypothetical protein